MADLTFYDLTYEGPVVQAILDTAQDLRQNGYIFKGVGTPSTVPGTPTQRVWYLCGPGTYANFGTSVTVPEGSVMVASYASGAWTKTVVEVTGGGVSFSSGETVGDVSLFDELSDLDNKTSAEKAAMIPDGNVIEEIVENGEYIRTTIDLSHLNKASVNSTTTKFWGNAYNGIFLPVKAGEVYEIVPQSGFSQILIPLKTCAFKNGVSYANNIATGYSDRVVIAVGDTLTMTIPSDCTTLYLQTKLGGGDCMPTVTRIDQLVTLDTTPTAGSSKAVNSDGVYKFASNLEDLSNYTTHSGVNLSTAMIWTTNANANFRLYAVSGGEYLRIKANSSYASIFGFLISAGTMVNNTQPTMTGGRYSLSVGDVYETIIPSGTNYVYILTDDQSGDHTPEELAIYTKKEQDESVTHISVNGAAMTAFSSSTNLKGGRVYSIALDKVIWSVRNISSGYVVFSLVFGAQFVRILKGDAPKKTYYVAPSSDGVLSISGRADTGVQIGITITDVTDEFNKLAYDLHFVDDGVTKESMMVKVGIGDLVKYSVFTSASTATLKAYSRAVRDNTYLVDSITSAGAYMGEYMPLQDVFVVVTSDTGTVASCQVYNQGETTDKLKDTGQFIVDVANATTILSTTDADATTYDNIRINNGCVMPFDGKYIMLYQGFGTFHSGSSTWLMAYSTNGTTWTRGVPSGITPPYAGTNVIFKRGTIVGKFSTEVLNEAAVCKVADHDYPFRLVGNIRNDNPNTYVGEVMWIFKSADLANWTPIRQITAACHDTFPSAITYGDTIKVYVRMRDNTQAADKVRMIGYMMIDYDGNVIVPPTGLFGNGLYAPASARIDSDKELFIPPNLHVISEPNGDCAIESYIKVGNNLRYAPSYGLDMLNNKSGNWLYTLPIVSVGMKQYLFYALGNAKHGSVTQQDMKMCELQWITNDEALT